MINTDRIVPVTVIDLISLYGLILQQNSDIGTDLASISADTTDGHFTLDQNGTEICNEPLRVMDLGTYATAENTIYFVPAYNYEGFVLSNGTSVTTTGDTVNPDGRTLYKATVSSSGTVTIEQVGF